MELQEALFRKKLELRSANRKIAALEKKIDKHVQGLAEKEIFQNQLSHIQGLNFKVSEITRIADRYKHLYEQTKRELDSLAGRFSTLEYHCRDLQWQIDCSTGKPTPDGITAAERAMAKIKALEDEVARLTALLNKDGTTTGTPTSKTGIDKKKVIPNSREKSHNTIGGQPGHEKHSMPAFSEEEITGIITHEVDSCPDCGGHLSEIRDIPKDELDYEVKVVKKRHIFKEYRCDNCGKIFRTGNPSLKAENQYGSVIQAMALALMNLGFVSIGRTRKLLSGLTTDILGISDGYISKLQKRYSNKLISFVEEVRTACIASLLIYWDDTVIFINTSRACFRFYGNEKLAFYTAHMHKDLEGIMDDSLLPSLSSATIVMHDHNTINYHDGFVFQNVECLQHLERDLEKVAKDSGHSWASELKELIKSMIHRRKLLISAGTNHFEAAEIASFLSAYNGLLKSGYKEYFKEPHRFFSQFENSLLVRLEAYRDNYTAWIHDFSIPTTNNLSERSLRFIKCRDKISGQFQNEAHAQFFANIHTYIETCKRNGINEFQAILRLTQNNPYSLTELLTLSGT